MRIMVSLMSRTDRIDDSDLIGFNRRALLPFCREDFLPECERSNSLLPMRLTMH